jgi:hypothetical protein
MMTWKCALGVLGMAVGLLGCESGCGEEAIDRAVAFIDENQACETADDCVAVGDLCAEIPGGFCGQIAMSKKGAESSEWKTIERELSDCAPSSCDVCLAELVPTCTAGSCRRR